MILGPGRWNDRKIWDAFISHASEDKATVARPLAARLNKAGAKVWFDEVELRLGDSLTEKIDLGLSLSRFGIVILSDAFFAKNWPRSELAGLRALQESGKTIILPVWHKMDKSAVARRSPIMADILSASTDEGLGKVCRKILDVIFSPGSGSPSQVSREAIPQLAKLLDINPDKEKLISFIKANRQISNHLMRSDGPVLWDAEIAGKKFDALSITDATSHSRCSLHCVTFLPLWQNPFNEPEASTEISPVLKQACSDAAYLEKIYRSGTRSFSTIAPFWRDCSPKIVSAAITQIIGSDWERMWERRNPLLRFTLFAGRRNAIERTDATRNAWIDMKSQQLAEIRTYDGLIEILQRRTEKR